MAKKFSFAQQVCIRVAGKCMQKTAQLWPGCRVGVAISGGVDSCVLLKVLQLRQKIVPFAFELMALHLNPGFVPDNHRQMLSWVTDLGIAAHMEVTDYGIRAHSAENQRKSACFRCAWLRRKHLFSLCAKYKLSHLAFGHNLDDLTTTFFMNLARNGRVEGMLMHEPFFAGQLHVIRPLLLVEKKYIQSAARQWQLPVFTNPCPSAGYTERSDMGERIKHVFEGENMLRTVRNALARHQLQCEQVTK